MYVTEMLALKNMDGKTIGTTFLLIISIKIVITFFIGLPF